MSSMAEVRSRRNQAKSIVARGQKRLNLSAKRPQTFLQSLLGRGNHARSKSENAEKKDIVSHAGKKLQILLLRRKQNHSRKEDDAIIEVSPHIDDPQTSTQPRCPILPRLPFQDSMYYVQYLSKLCLADCWRPRSQFDFPFLRLATRAQIPNHTTCARSR